MKHKEFAVFIMVHGRPDKMWTYQTLRRGGYTGKIYLVGDNLDSTIDGYKKKYKDELLVFDKNEAASKMDAGDNTGDLRSTLFSANTIPELAKGKGIEYFFIMCDDYNCFSYKFNEHLKFISDKSITNLDFIFDSMVDFMEKNKNVSSLAMAQTGDFIGGKHGGYAKKPTLKRKAMNSFLCSTDRPFKFIGRLNEDVTTYVNLGGKGVIFFTIPLLSITQKETQTTEGGLSDVYLEYGTYTKSFFSVMYNPSSVKVSMIGVTHKRLHHRINWKHAVPLIVNEKHRKRSLV